MKSDFNSSFTPGNTLRFCLLAMLILLVFGCATDPIRDQRRSLYQEQEVGRSALAKIAGQQGLVRDDILTRYLTQLLQSLAMYVERQDLVYRAAVLDTEQVNAYALPGGYVLLTRGLLLEVDSVHELVGVLAHELGHIQLGHPTDHVSIEDERGVLESLTTILAGRRQIVTTAADQINSAIEERLFLQGYDQADEYDADRYAVQLLGDIGLSAEPYIELLQRLVQQQMASYESFEDLNRTHPPIEERVAQMRKFSIPNLKIITMNQEFEAARSRLESAE